VCVCVCVAMVTTTIALGPAEWLTSNNLIYFNPNPAPGSSAWTHSWCTVQSNKTTIGVRRIPERFLNPRSTQIQICSYECIHRRLPVDVVVVVDVHPGWPSAREEAVNYRHKGGLHFFWFNLSTICQHMACTAPQQSAGFREAVSLNYH